ncbi:MAG: MATE family efflux transporter [Chloroflexi bacterium]|nr:MATE family efflux transporter [Chloroflexota bacterium]MBU1750304.1 MATE family efflux transporter [Chloroflexota bacterium]
MADAAHKEQQPIDLRPEALNRTIVRLAAPAVLENLLVTMVFFADAVLIGWLHDDAALAAVGLSGTFMWIANGLFQAIAISATAMVARFYGERNFDLAERTGGQAMNLGIFLALLFTFIMIPFSDEFLTLMGAEAEVVRQGSEYINIMLATSVFSFPMLVASGIMRGAGDTTKPMIITLIMNVWNVIAATVLIFGLGPIPAMHLAGAGIATSSARMVGGLLSMAFLFTGYTAIRVTPRRLLTWDWGIIQRIVRLSIPNIGEQVITRVGNILFMRIITDLGTASLAAHGIAVRVESISFMPGWGLAVATTTIVGQALGSGQVDEAGRSVRRTVILAVAFMSLVGLIFVSLAQPIVSIFGSTPGVLALAAVAVQVAALEQPTIGITMVLNGAMRGAGDTRTPMWVALFGVLFFRVLTVYLFAIVLGLGLAGVWLGTAADWAGRSVLIYWFYRRGRWKHVTV